MEKLNKCMSKRKENNDKCAMKMDRLQKRLEELPDKLAKKCNKKLKHSKTTEHIPRDRSFSPGEILLLEELTDKNNKILRKSKTAEIESPKPKVKMSDKDWNELTADERKAAKYLGQNSHTWNNNKRIRVDDLQWRQLTEEQQKAAQMMGQDQQKWDSNEGEETMPMCDRDWQELSEEEIQAVQAMGQDQNTWNNDKKIPADDLSWVDLTEAQQKAAEMMGQDQPTWDAEENQDSEDEKAQKVHKNIICDACEAEGKLNDDIIGNRFKCAVCPDYDLCEAHQNANVHEHDLFIRFGKEDTIKKEKVPKKTSSLEIPVPNEKVHNDLDGLLKLFQENVIKNLNLGETKVKDAFEQITENIKKMSQPYAVNTDLSDPLVSKKEEDKTN